MSTILWLALTQLLASAMGVVASSAAAAVGAVAAPASTAQGTEVDPMGCFIDSRFRHDVAAVDAGGTTPTTEASEQDRSSARDTAEISRIFMSVSCAEPLPAEDIR